MADARSLLREANAARKNQATADGGKKRKATSTLSQGPGRKKPKSGPITPAAVDIAEEEVDVQSSVGPAKQAGDDAIDGSATHEAELAALDRDLALMDAATIANNTVQAAPAVSAPPITAAELAVQARIDQSEQRGRKEIELEAEREDAARALEDEFDAMDGLEERAKRLRERREALRKANSAGQREESEASATGLVPLTSQADVPRTIIPGTNAGMVEDDENEDEDEDDDDDDFADWNFGTRA